MKIVLISGLWGERNYTIFRIASKLIDLLEPDKNIISWIATNAFNQCPISSKVNVINIPIRSTNKSFISILIKFILYQIHIMKLMIRLIFIGGVDTFIFGFGADLFLFPIILARIFRKRVILRIEGRPSYIAEESLGETNRFKLYLLRLVEQIAYIFASRIALECSYLAEKYDLMAYRDKMAVLNLYVPNSFFKKIKPFQERAYKVGHVGGLHEIKGSLDFANALQLILPNNEEKAIIIGKGTIEDKIKQTIISNNIEDRVDIIGWVDNFDLPSYLNNIKIIVLPSYKEGLPNIVIESMACGCIVLANPIGGIPDIITDGITGFILDGNSPERIAKGVSRIMAHPNLENIVTNARNKAEQEYSYKSTIKTYKKLLAEIC